jgi:hypothetical protein
VCDLGGSADFADNVDIRARFRMPPFTNGEYRHHADDRPGPTRIPDELGSETDP